MLSANGRMVVNQVGFGFDAHIANLFASTKKRGLFKYALLSLKEYYQYRNPPFAFHSNGKDYEVHTFVTNFSNNTQFGNKAHIAPLADLRDGLIEISLLRHFPKFLLPVILLRLFSKTLHKSRYYTSFKATNVVIPPQGNVILNIDGEPLEITEEMEIKILPEALRVIAKSRAFL
jgi:diacylglycerol kinase family enzyme